MINFMTIHLPIDVENSIHAEVLSGHFASADEAIAAAWRAFQQQQKLPLPKEHAAAESYPAQAGKPIWDEIQELTADVADEVWDALPTDLAERHNHYLYGVRRKA